MFYLYAVLCQRRVMLLGRLLQSLGAPDAVRLRVLAWERVNPRRIRLQLLTVKVHYQRILLRECWEWWSKPWRDLV